MTTAAMTTDLWMLVASALLFFALYMLQGFAVAGATTCSWRSASPDRRHSPAGTA